MTDLFRDQTSIEKEENIEKVILGNVRDTSQWLIYVWP